MKTVCLIIGLIGVVSASTNTPAIIWSSATSLSESKTVNSPISALSTEVLAILGHKQDSTIISTLAPTSLPSVLVLYTEKSGLTSQILAKRSDSFVSILPTIRLEAPFTSGITSSELTSILGSNSLQIPCGTSISDMKTTISNFLSSNSNKETALIANICIDNQETDYEIINQVETTIQSTGLSSVSIYTGISKEEEIKTKTTKATAVTTTIWSGPVLSFLFAAALMLSIMVFAIKLMFSLQTQVEADVPKQKVI